MIWRWSHGLLRTVPPTGNASRHEVWIWHSKELLGQGIVGEELQRRGRRQGTGVARMGVVKATCYWQVIAKQLHLVLNPL